MRDNPTHTHAQLHAALGDQHKDNLKALYVVHASLPARAAIAAMTLTGVGMSRRVWAKAVYVDSLASLYSYVPPSQVHVRPVSSLGWD